MLLELEGKSALVTGGSKGIGAAIVEQLAGQGAHVVFTYNSSKAAADSLVARIDKAGGTVDAIQADAGEKSANEKAANKALELLGGGLDILVHNAGVSLYSFISEESFENYRKTFEVNVDGVFLTTKAVEPNIRDGGRIIIISSVNSHTVPTRAAASYSASKSALVGFTRGWARDLGARNILVNAINPGPIDTDMNPDGGDFSKVVKKLTALRRYGQPSEVAKLVGFLASDAASYITGTSITIDGGMSV